LPLLKFQPSYSVEISGFRRRVDELFALLGCYAAYIDNLSTFRNSLPVLFSRAKMGPIGCPETSVNNNHIHYVADIRVKCSVFTRLKYGTFEILNMRWYVEVCPVNGHNWTVKIYCGSTPTILLLPHVRLLKLRKANR